jgi:hypothetical protein
MCLCASHSQGAVWAEARAVLVSWDVEKKQKSTWSTHFLKTVAKYEEMPIPEPRQAKLTKETSSEVKNDGGVVISSTFRQADKRPLRLGDCAEISKVFGVAEVCLCMCVIVCFGVTGMV